MADIRETSFDTGDFTSIATITSSEKKWINKINKLSEQYPDEVQVLRHPEDNDGYILAHVPKSWMKLTPKHKRDISEEQRAILSERIKKARGERGKN